MVEHARHGSLFAAREKTTYRSSSPEDMAALKERIAQDSFFFESFQDRVTRIEEAARQRLREAGLPGSATAWRVPGRPWIEIHDESPLPVPRDEAPIEALVEAEGHAHDSPVGVAASTIWLVYLMRHRADRWDIASAAYMLGSLQRLMSLQRQFERPAEAGVKMREGLAQKRKAHNAARKAERAPEWARWQAKADEIWERNPHLSAVECARQVQRRLGLLASVHTIRQRLLKKVDRAS